MKFKFVYIAIPFALMLTACGETEFASPGIPIVPGPTPSPSPSPVVTPTPGPSPVACFNDPNVPPSRPLYAGSAVGEDNGSAVAVSNIIADQRLRLQIKPVAIGSNKRPYKLAGATVTLVRNGADGRTVAGTIVLPDTAETINPASGYSFTFSKGIPVGVKSEVVDFSDVLGVAPLRDSNDSYSVEISEVQTDWTCTSLCTYDKYAYNYATGNGCFATNYCGTNSWNYDIHSKKFYCCVHNFYYADNSLNQCQKDKCNIGKLRAKTASDPAGPLSTWQFAVSVETESTPCIN